MFVVVRLKGHLPALSDDWEVASRLERGPPDESDLVWHIGHPMFCSNEGAFSVWGFVQLNLVGGREEVELKVSMCKRRTKPR